MSPWLLAISDDLDDALRAQDDPARIALLGLMLIYALTALGY